MKRYESSTCFITLNKHLNLKQENINNRFCSEIFRIETQQNVFPFPLPNQYYLLCIQVGQNISRQSRCIDGASKTDVKTIIT